MSAVAYQEVFAAELAPESGSFSPVPDRPIDLVHLSRQTMGDTELETELLMLFDKQAAMIVQRLEGPAPLGKDNWQAELAHLLKGSARAIGAARVARAAADFEVGCGPHALEELTGAVHEARGMIHELLAG